MRAYILKRFLLMVLLLSSVSVYSLTLGQLLYLTTALSLAVKGARISPVSKENGVIYIDSYIDGTEASGGNRVDNPTKASSGSGMPPNDLEASADDEEASSGSGSGVLPVDPGASTDHTEASGDRDPIPTASICKSLASLKRSFECPLQDVGDKKGLICMTSDEFYGLKDLVGLASSQTNDAFYSWGYWKNATLSSEAERKRIGGEYDQLYARCGEQYKKHIEIQKQADKNARLLSQCKAGKRQCHNNLNNCKKKINKDKNIHQPRAKSKNNKGR